MTAALPEPTAIPEHAEAPTVVRLRGAADVIAAVPPLLGFHPSESLVLCCLRGRRKRHCLTMRVDLPSPAQTTGMARDLAAKARSAGADRVLVLIYTETGGGPVRRDVVRALQDALAGQGIEVEDALRVGRGRWWAYLCEQESCCPSAGTPLPDTPGSGALHLQAEMVGSGLRVHADRAQLLASIAPVGFLARAGLEQAYELVDREIGAQLLAGEQRSLGEQTIGVCHALRERFIAGNAQVSDREAAQVGLGLLDVRARDAVLAWAGAADCAPLLAMLTQLARKALPPAEAPVCTVLAHVAYQSGDGALAVCALDRALRSDPAYQLALLLEHALAHAVHPSVLAAAFAAPDRRAGRSRRGRGGQRP